jgi:ERCC4-type nuclease
LKEIGKVSAKPERYGADFLIRGNGKLMGVQRKLFPDDLVASLNDGRLYEQIHKMQGLDYAIYLMEGFGKWSHDGFLIDHNSKAVFTIQQIRGLMFSLRFEYGMFVVQTKDMRDTAETLMDLEHWLRKAKHDSLKRRPGPKRDGWGKVSSRDFSLHLLQSFEGVGPDLAGKIFDHFGRLPFAWDISPEQLREVPFVGPKTVERLFDAFDM